jgi:F0F1-type ATP synthase membrane subunit b/b'
MKRALMAAVCVFGLASGAAFAAKPARNVSENRHPNIAAAQRLTAEAYQKIEAAQRANEFDLGGHAEKAKQLLEQANNELKEAALHANKK